MIIEFACVHDYENGDSPWHIFDKNSNYIKVYTKTTTSRYDEGYHVFLYPDQVRPFISGVLKKTDDEVWITWSPYETYDFQKTLDNFSERRVWNAEIAHDWIVYELIPQVIYWFEKRNCGLNYKLCS